MSYYKTYDDSREHSNYVYILKYVVLTNKEEVVVGNIPKLLEV